MVVLVAYLVAERVAGQRHAQAHDFAREVSTGGCISSPPAEPLFKRSEVGPYDCRMLRRVNSQTSLHLAHFYPR